MGIIIAPFIVGIVAYAIYKLFELILRRKERLMIVEKLNPNADNTNFNLSNLFGSTNLIGRFTALRAGCLLLGLGLGLICGIIISANINLSGVLSNFRGGELIAIINGASIMLFGGLGMLASFMIENKMSKKGKEE